MICWFVYLFLSCAAFCLSSGETPQDLLEAGQELESLINTSSKRIESPSNESNNSLGIHDLRHFNDTMNSSSPDVSLNDTTIERNSSSKLIETETSSHVDSADLDDISLNFLSFEEWVQKKARANSKNAAAAPSQKRVKAARGDDEYSVGEENEIDFDIFTPAPHEKSSLDKRFNYASLDCAAAVVETNSGAKGASLVLLELKELYLLNECGFPEQYMVIELCEDILIDTISMGNYEFFSLIFKTVVFLVSDRYPVSTWRELGRFEATNKRDIQSFSIDNPLIWARYLRIDIVGHFGHEFYCPVSIVRVHGRTMMEEYKLREAGEKAKGPEHESEDGSVPSKDIEDKVTKQSSSPTDLPEIESPEVAPDKGLFQATEITYAGNMTGLESKIMEITNSSMCEKGVSQFESFLAELKRNESCEPDYQLDASKKALSMANTTKIAKKSEPVTQESIYKNIMKRLLLLELNASLSMLYIEEQSRLLTEAFGRLEKKLSNKFTMLVLAINETFQSQMKEFQDTFELFQSDSRSLLQSQESKSQHTYGKIDRNFSRLSSELQFQKRIVALLFVVVVCLLVYVVLTRDTFIEGEYLDEVLDKEVARYREMSADTSMSSFQDSDPESPNKDPESPQFVMAHPSHSQSSPTLSPLLKRRLKLKFTNKFGSTSSSTILLDDGMYTHRKSPSNASSIGSVLSDTEGPSGGVPAKQSSGLKTVLSHGDKRSSEEKSLLTPNGSDTEQ